MKIAGIDIGGTSIKMGVFYPDKGLVNSEAVPSVVGDYKETARMIAAFCQKEEVDVVGIGTAGAVTPDGLVTAGNLKWDKAPFLREIKSRLSCAVWIDNDAQVAIRSEQYDGVCKDVTNALYLTLGTGIGGAVIINGKPWRGHNNTAAEMGHIITHAEGIPCSCGKQGCFEAYASATALFRTTKCSSVSIICEAIRNGDSKITEAFEHYVHEIGIGIISLVSVFQPEVVVIGGGVSYAGNLLLDGIRKEMNYYNEIREDKFYGKILLATHLNDAGMIGAALLAVDNCHSDG